MNENEIFNLYILMKKKKIRQNELAEFLDVSSSFISQVFALKMKMSKERFKQMKEYIENKETF